MKELERICANNGCEYRVIKDVNNFYKYQFKMVEDEDEWRTTYISSVPLTLTKPYPYHAD